MQKSNTPSLVDSLLQSPEFEAATDNMKLFKVAALADDLQKKLTAAQEHAERLRVALEKAKNGLEWYREEHPIDNSPADDEMHAEIDAALAATPSGGRSEWLPMDSAPEDGTNVMLHLPDEEEIVSMGFFDAEDEQWFYLQGPMAVSCEPASWQPLPKAPETIAQEGAA